MKNHNASALDGVAQQLARLAEQQKIEALRVSVQEQASRLEKIRAQTEQSKPEGRISSNSLATKPN
jgi:hypothetical protein